jgi:hypothetical protein
VHAEKDQGKELSEPKDRAFKMKIGASGSTQFRSPMTEDELKRYLTTEKKRSEICKKTYWN